MTKHIAAATFGSDMLYRSRRRYDAQFSYTPRLAANAIYFRIPHEWAQGNRYAVLEATAPTRLKVGFVDEPVENGDGLYCAGLYIEGNMLCAYLPRDFVASHLAGRRSVNPNTTWEESGCSWVAEMDFLRMAEGNQNPPFMLSDLDLGGRLSKESEKEWKKRMQAYLAPELDLGADIESPKPAAKARKTESAIAPPELSSLRSKRDGKTISVSVMKGGGSTWGMMRLNLPTEVFEKFSLAKVEIGDDGHMRVWARQRKGRNVRAISRTAARNRISVTSLLTPYLDCRPATGQTVRLGYRWESETLVIPDVIDQLSVLKRGDAEPGVENGDAPAETGNGDVSPEPFEIPMESMAMGGTLSGRSRTFWERVKTAMRVLVG